MIVLLETVHPDAQRVLEDVDGVVLTSEPTTIDPEIPRTEVRAILTRGRGRITERTFEEFPSLVAVARCGAGLDNIDRAAAANAGVTVVHAPGSTTHAVAESATMLMLALARGVVGLHTAVAAGEWHVREGYEGVELRGKRLGVVGLGAIGRRVAEVGRALDMEVVGWTRSGSGTVPVVSLDELVATSDVIQICVALTPETVGLFDATRFAAMKPGALLVNTARGPIVDHRALGAALTSGAIGGYAADVWEPEPPPGPDRDVIRDHCVVTPHVAGLTDVTFREICLRPARSVADLVAGRDPDPSTIAPAPAAVSPRGAAP